MKLPTDKKERMQWLVMIFIGAVVVLSVAVYFGIIPILEKRSKMKADILDLSEKLAKAQKENGRKKDVVESDRKTLQEIKDISNNYIIKPVMGNYVLMASDFIEAQAKKVGIKNVSVSERGFAEMVTRSGEELSKSVKAYIVHVNVVCGYNDLIKLIRQIENANPYYSITDISISSQPAKDPRQQIVSFDIQWPTWRDLDMPNQVDQQISRLSDDARPELEVRKK